MKALVRQLIRRNPPPYQYLLGTLANKMTDVCCQQLRKFGSRMRSRQLPIWRLCRPHINDNNFYVSFNLIQEAAAGEIAISRAVHWTGLHLSLIWPADICFRDPTPVPTPYRPSPDGTCGGFEKYKCTGTGTQFYFCCGPRGYCGVSPWECDQDLGWYVLAPFSAPFNRLAKSEATGLLTWFRLAIARQSSVSATRR